MTKESREESLTFLEIVMSIFAAAFGVQNRRKMERDFTHGEVVQFIAAGAMFTIAFIVGMILIVNLVLSHLAG